MKIKKLNTMKKIIIICLMVISNMLQAQTEPPVAWDIALIKNELGTFAQLNVSLEKGWHIFAYDAGGDGLAINTTVVLETYNQKNKKIGEIELKDSSATEKPISVNMEGFGIVNYFDKNFSYLAPIAADVYKVQVKVTYQTCNDKMCLPPTDKILSLQIKSNK
jgi:Disulphide bond corrector protein DsbC